MQEITEALYLSSDFNVSGEGDLPSCFKVTELAAASFGAVGMAVAALTQATSGRATAADVTVDRRLASLWFARSIFPIGWEMSPAWDAIAGDYKAKDGWIKLHTNLPHHKKAALKALGCAEDRASVMAAIKSWDKDTLEAAIVTCGGVAAAMRPHADWAEHPGGKAVAAEPLVAWAKISAAKFRDWQAPAERPLAGLKVLDLTRVLAGPVTTRTLAGFGADVLRVDPIGWDEAFVVPDITLGKRCCRLNLRDGNDRAKFEALLQGADILVHGYRPDALKRLGYGEAYRRELAPNLIDISLDAYGWTGPWAGRRGFDSLVQMSCGIAHTGMQRAGNDRPTPLPVQALDHATGYIMAAAAIVALTRAVGGEGIHSAKLSLARTAALLLKHRQDTPGTMDIRTDATDFNDTIEATPWGPAHRLKPAVHIEGTPMAWSRAACELGSAEPNWL